MLAVDFRDIARMRPVRLEASYDEQLARIDDIARHRVDREVFARVVSRRWPHFYPDEGGEGEDVDFAEAGCGVGGVDATDDVAVIKCQL